MLTIRSSGPRLCDHISRRDVLQVGSLGLLGLSIAELRRAQAAPARGGPAKSCILLFLMGGPPQHSTWDPKPDNTLEIRGEFKPIDTAAPGMQFGELMPQLARQANKLCVLRGVATNDNAHSSSGYYMMTGQPHQPMNSENAKPGAPNNWPTLGGCVQRLRKAGGSLPAAVRLPHRIFNTDGSVWPGQDAGFLGRNADPWLLNCEVSDSQKTFDGTITNIGKLRVPDFSLDADVPADRLQDRQMLLDQVGRSLDAVQRADVLSKYDHQTHQAFDLLRSAQSLSAFQLDQEPVVVRDRYGHSPFGQSVLLARRLIEAGVSLVQVNWFRGPNEPADNPCWDSHKNESERLKTVLLPPMDQAFSALLEDLAQRGRLEETLVVCLSEFGRTPKFTPRGGGRDHWGHVFSVALAGGGIRGGQIYGASDKIGGYPRDGLVRPEDLTATILHCLGYSPDTEVQDTLGRPLPITRGRVIQPLF